MWNAVGEYADGTRIEKNFLYLEASGPLFFLPIPCKNQSETAL